MVTMSRSRQIAFGLAIVVLVSVAAVFLGPRTDVLRQNLPDQLSDSEFWKVISESSEQADTFGPTTSSPNESAFQRVIPTLKKQIQPSGVYLGVGPEQNFTYLTTLRRSSAFIVDIRRQNMLLHLMYKAIFELSANDRNFFQSYSPARYRTISKVMRRQTSCLKSSVKPIQTPTRDAKILNRYSPSCATVTIST